MTRVTSAMCASDALRWCSFENSTVASERSSRRRSRRWSLRSVYSRTRSGTSTFLPLTMVRMRHLRGHGDSDPSIGRHRSRATVQAETAGTPAASSAIAAAARVEPVVRTSSTSRTQRPRISGPDPGVRDDREGAADVARPVAPVEVELGDRRAVTGHRRDVGQPELAGRDPGDELGLVVAAPATSLGVDRDVDHDLRPATDPPPAPRDGVAERLREPLLGAVLDPVQGGPGHAPERRAPVDLEERRRDVRGHPDGHARPARRGAHGWPAHTPRTAAAPRAGSPRRHPAGRHPGPASWPPARGRSSGESGRAPSTPAYRRLTRW